MGGGGGQHHGVQELADPGGFEQHARESAAEEHDGDGDVLEILRRPVRVAEMLEESVGRAVEEDHKGLGELR